MPVRLTAMVAVDTLHVDLFLFCLGTCHMAACVCVVHGALLLTPFMQQDVSATDMYSVAAFVSNAAFNVWFEW